MHDLRSIDVVKRGPDGARLDSSPAVAPFGVIAELTYDGATDTLAPAVAPRATTLAAGPPAARVRYTLHVPVLDNDAHPLGPLHAHVARILAREFHGFTRLDGAGFWPGAQASPDSEAVTLYVVDADDSARTLATLHALARHVRDVAEQDAVYLTRQAIETWLV